MLHIMRDYFLSVSILVITGWLTMGNAGAQESRPSRQAAEAAWNAGDFEKAYQNYNGLLLIYSRDPQYAYYAGACLVELDRDNNRALTLLNSAIHSSQSVKNIPAEVWLYYGRALKQSGNCAEAVTAIEKYRKIVGKKRAAETNAQRYIDECAGNYSVTETPAGDTKQKGKAEADKQGKKKDNSGNGVKDIIKLKASADRYQSKSDSLIKIAQEIRKKIDTSPEDVRGLMKSRVIELEEQAGYYLSSADSIRQVLGLEPVENHYFAQRPLPGAGSADSGFAATTPVTDSRQITAAENHPLQDDKRVTKPADISNEYDRKLTEAMHMQYMADSLNRTAASLRRQSVGETEDNKRLMSTTATAMEADAVRYQSESDRMLLALEPGEGKSADSGIVKTAEAPAPPAKKEENETVKTETAASVTSAAVSDLPPSAPAKKPVYSCFEIKETPPYSAGNPFPAARNVKEGLVYQIQLAAFRNPVATSYFRNLYPVYGIINASKGVTYYYTGIFRTRDAASQSLPVVRKNGFPDAFVVAFLNDQQVSMEKAADAEKQWSDKPLYYEETAADKPVADATKNAATLSFRAEVMRYTRPMKPEVLKKAELLAGTKKMDIIKNNKGESVVLIGNFITFESADEYVSLLKRNGYNNAKVVAYVGSSEMPLEKARELLKETLNE